MNPRLDVHSKDFLDLCHELSGRSHCAKKYVFAAWHVASEAGGADYACLSSHLFVRELSQRRRGMMLNII